MCWTKLASLPASPSARAEAASLADLVTIPRIRSRSDTARTHPGCFDITTRTTDPPPPMNARQPLRIHHDQRKKKLKRCQRGSPPVQEEHPTKHGVIAGWPGLVLRRNSVVRMDSGR